MPACLALTREHEPWRAANRASAISCGASHLRLKSATGIHTLHHTDCSQDCGLRVMVRAAVSTTCFRHRAKTRMRPKAAHEHACFAGCTNMGLTGMVFVRGYSCRAKPGSCRGACREPKVGMARRRLTKVDGAGMSNRSRIACNSTFKSRRRHAIPAAKPLGKPPHFVVARSANPICRHIWNSICGIAAMLTNRVFAHKSPGTPN